MILQKDPIIIYGYIFVCYHLTEFLFHRLMHGEFSGRSLLFSLPYIAAQAVLLGEYFFIKPLMPLSTSMVTLGLVGVAIGLGFRWTAIVTAKKSFNHTIQTSKAPSHELILHGPYRLFRHPSYAGWYLYSLSIPLLLGVPLSFICFSVVGWRFFRERIRFEEAYLIDFFGRDYLTYKAKTRSGIPFIP
jgi:protein-S-isoprenylcysteine O-methyltransferase